jgi:hypothetical protein
LRLESHISHSHEKRPHQGKGNAILFPSARIDQKPEELTRCQERLGGLLKGYHREAA